MAEFPGFTIWTDAYLADTGHLTTLEHGAYFLLLMAMWRAGGYLPNDDVKLARFCRLAPKEWARIRDHLLEFFTEDDGKITQGRLLDELEKARDRSRKAADSARAKYRKTKKVAPANARPEQSSEPAQALLDACSEPASISISISNNKKDPPSGDPKKKGSRIPDDFVPDLEWATQEGLSRSEAIREAASFKDYWIAKTGKDATKQDWPATWRNWVRNQLKRKRGPPAGGGKSAFRQHQDEVTQSFRDALRGTEYDQSHHDDRNGQPAFDLESGDFFSDRTASAGKR